MNNTLITIFAIFFIFFMTTLGAGLVFIINHLKFKDKANSITLGLASGIMISASIFSLLVPAISLSKDYFNSPYLVPSICFILGGIFISITSIFTKQKNKQISLDFVKNSKNQSKNIVKSHKKAQNHTKNDYKYRKLFIAVTMHNIPEGLAVGLAFGTALTSLDSTLITGALMLAIGIGVQNFPEGLAVALPIKIHTGNVKRAFILGTLSGCVEPIFAILGLLLSSSLPILMPFLLSLSAGAMIFVVVSELLTDNSFVKYDTIGSFGFIFGFLIMMLLDLSF